MTKVKAKAKAAKKSVRRKKQKAKTEDDPIVARWKAGDSLATLSTDLQVDGWTRSKLRRHITQKVGGKEAFRKLRDEGAGGSTALFGGKKGRPTRTAEVRLDEDKNVERISHARKIDGWGMETIYVDVGGPALKDADVYLPLVPQCIHISPEGVEYVVAKTIEKADLIVEVEGLPPVRLKKLAESSVGRKVNQAAALRARGEKAQERKRAKKRARRRKGGI